LNGLEMLVVGLQQMQVLMKKDMGNSNVLREKNLLGQVQVQRQVEGQLA
jgi:hypothetical protein